MARQDYLRSELRLLLDSKKSSNNGYSLRAFARDLRLSPARLSGFLNSKHNISKDNYYRLVKLIDKNVNVGTSFFKEFSHSKPTELDESSKLRLHQAKLTISRTNGLSWLHEFTLNKNGLLFCYRNCPDEKIGSTPHIGLLSGQNSSELILKITWSKNSHHLIKVTEYFWLGFPTEAYYAKTKRNAGPRTAQLVF